MFKKLLRDWFAITAPAEFCIVTRNEVEGALGQKATTDDLHFAQCCKRYAYADTMMRARDATK
jgi:hypothetical protein